VEREEASKEFDEHTKNISVSRIQGAPIDASQDDKKN
jgi:hypothetical protein